MIVRIEIRDNYDGHVIEDLGECLTDSPGRALQMYEGDLDKWLERGESAYLAYTEAKCQN